MPKRKIPLEELDVDGNEQYYDSGAAATDDDDYVEDPQSNRKRRQTVEHSTQADLEYEEEDNNNSSGAPGFLGDGDKAHDVNYVVKLILTKDARGQNFQKMHINQYLTNKRFKTDSLLDDAIAILQNIYGLTLVDAPTVKQERKFHSSQRKQTEPLNSANGDKNSKRQLPRNRFFLASSLSKQAQEVLGELWMKKVDSSLDKTKIGDARFFIPKYTKSPLPRSNSDLVKTGIMILVTTLVILSENHIMESQLIRSLKKFGISESVNMKNTNLNMNWDDILKELVSREYLTKVQLDASANDKIYSISLGRRSITELTPMGVYGYIKTLYGSDFNEVIADRTRVTIERAYGVELKNENKEIEEEEQQIQVANNGETETT
ncbi:hypothetical protein CORT_0E04040 [Candida orthopsilosis Co 90-125]|uniref:MAGE domain-containing protein n=1 Tax=Candida orthopsilosis (strain 90-125) TaxID=1136231 RepID=H8X763_CANO9|nr:hypothetical protein CORT_0E04040 [Candida orthopsilosis Co 90-125]CCG23991.1 hypothetical protein CORT_0E04040 [Candida orthopsilosis Co 90-125]